MPRVISSFRLKSLILKALKIGVKKLAIYFFLAVVTFFGLAGLAILAAADLLIGSLMVNFFSKLPSPKIFTGVFLSAIKPYFTKASASTTVPAGKRFKSLRLKITGRFVFCDLNLNLPLSIGNLLIKLFRILVPSK